MTIVHNSHDIPEEARLIELAVSMLANMARFEDLAEKISSEPELRETIFSKVLWMPDSDALVQLCRLLGNVLAGKVRACLIADMSANNLS